MVKKKGCEWGQECDWGTSTMKDISKTLTLRCFRIKGKVDHRFYATPRG